MESSPDEIIGASTTTTSAMTQEQQQHQQSDDDSIPEPDDFLDDLDLSFDNDMYGEQQQSHQQQEHMDGYIAPKVGMNKNSAQNDDDDDNDKQQRFTEYILGCLIVRVVAAKDLKPITKGGFVGGMMYSGGNGNGNNKHTKRMTPDRRRGNSKNGGNHNNNGRRHSRRQIMDKGYANPYATIVFGSQMQRTSVVYETVDPIWPRGKQSFFDVSLPVPLLAAQEQKDDGSLPPPPSSSENEQKEIKETSGKKESIETLLLQTDLDSKILTPLPPPAYKPILTIAISHSNENRNSGLKKVVKKGSSSSNSTHSDGAATDDDPFLGIANLDVTPILTGKELYIDEWLELGGGDDITGYVRVTCEYEPTDPPPRPGDMVRFTSFVDPLDVFPIPISQIFQVVNTNVKDIMNNNNNNHANNEQDHDQILLSYTTHPENWTCTFQAHSFMFICAKRHQTAVELYQDELIELIEKLSVSPALDAVTKTANSLPEEGLISVGMDVARGSLNLLGKWCSKKEGIIGAVVEDILYATNLDGQHSQQINEREDYDNDSDDDDEQDDDLSETSIDIDISDEDDDLSLDTNTDTKVENTPNGMPCCPISGQPMKNPVVAADGHTYEKASIKRWFRSSNISPLTGTELAHKKLVPNYLLLSTFQDSAKPI